MCKKVILATVCGLFLAFGVIRMPLCVAAENDPLMGHGDAAEIVVARVNGSVINMAQLMDFMLDLAEKRYGRREITPVLAQKIKDEAINKLIMEELAYQQASQIVHVSEDDVQREVARRIKAMGGESALPGFLKENQLKDRDAYSVSVMKVLTVKRYIEKTIDSRIKVSDADLKAAYEGAKEFFHTPENVQVTKIIFFDDPAKPGLIQKLKDIRAKIIKQYENKPEKMPVDGSFIVQKSIHLSETADKKLYAAARVLGKYEISEPIIEKGTAYLVQLTGYKPRVEKSFDMVKDYLRKEIYSRKKAPLLKKWRERLPKGAKIEIVDLAV